MQHRGVTWSFLVPKMIAMLLESAGQGNARTGGGRSCVGS